MSRLCTIFGRPEVIELLGLNLGNGMRVVGKFARGGPTDGAVTSGTIPEFADYLVEIGRTALYSFREQASAGAGMPQCACGVDERAWQRGDGQAATMQWFR